MFWVSCLGVSEPCWLCAAALPPPAVDVQQIRDGETAQIPGVMQQVPEETGSRLQACIPTQNLRCPGRCSEICGTFTKLRLQREEETKQHE